MDYRSVILSWYYHFLPVAFGYASFSYAILYSLQCCLQLHFLQALVHDVAIVIFLAYKYIISYKEIQRKRSLSQKPWPWADICSTYSMLCQVTSVVSDSVPPHRRQPTRLPCPWNSPGKNTGVGCHFLLQCMEVKSESEVAQSCPTVSDPMDCSLPGSSVHGIFQTRVLEWGAITFSSILYTMW